MYNEITIHQVTAALERAGLEYQIRGRYITAQCPKHQERNPSCQIFLDDFFCSCLAGCGRFHITDPFPELRNNTYAYNTPIRRPKIEPQHTYKTFDLTAYHAGLPLIPRVHTFKNLPLEILDDLGWRYDVAKNSYFIPYWNQDKTKIPFGQWRHLSGERRFTFLAGARPRLYGAWNIAPGERLFIVEGCSDAAVLQRCGIPWVALPSASSGGILTNFIEATKSLELAFTYAGDNDVAGGALKQALDGSGVSYRTQQPPAKYKDWGDFFVAEGDLAVFKHCKERLFE